MLRVQFTEDPDVGSVSLFQTLQGRGGEGRDLQIGRTIDSDIVLDSQRVSLLISRRHAVLSRRGQRLFLQDMGSTNGTYVNDSKLVGDERRQLNENDLISFGGAKLLRQAHRDYDEPNPFFFKLTDLPRLFQDGLPKAVPDNQPARQTAVQDVIDLTLLGDSPDNAAPVSRGPARKRTRERETHFIILEDDFDDLEPGQAPAPPPLPKPNVLETQLEGGAVGGPSTSGKAEGGSALLKAMESQFECTICREFLVAAHSLVPCGHMFCGECIGEWLAKKPNSPTCPTCRAGSTAAPVPSLKVDNMLDEIAPQLDAESRAERQRRKAKWGEVGKALTSRLQQQFRRGGHLAPPPPPHGHPGLPAFHHFANFHGLLEGFHQTHFGA